MANVFTGGGYVPQNTGQGSGSGGGTNATAEPSEEEKGKILTDIKDWVNGVFGGKKETPRSEADILRDKLAQEHIRTWPDVKANNWQLQQFLYINKQKYYNSPFLNAIAAYKYWEENKKKGLQGLNIVNTPTQWGVANLMNWLDHLYGLNFVYSQNLDELSQRKLPGNDAKKDPRAPEPDKQNSGGAYTGGTSSNTWKWVVVVLLGLGLIGAIVYFTTSNKTAAA